PFLEVQPAGAGELCWIYAAAVARGLRSPPPLPPGRRAGGAGAPQLAALGDAVFAEGGSAEDQDRPAHRRYLRVDSEQGVGYQALLALSDMPHHFRFPSGGGEWLVAAEQSRFPVDWCLRIRPVENPIAQASARRQARQLQSQVGEYDGDPAGAPPGLAEAIEALGDLRTQLAANPADAELRVTMILALGSDRLGDLEEQVTTLRSLYAAGDYQLHRPIGGQLGLFAAMLPGAPPGSPAGDYVHHLLGRDLAAGMPFGGVEVGDPRGALLGYNLDGGTFRPVLFDPAYGPSINRSGSLGAFGALGSGKSYFIKNAIHATLARGGRVTVLDRTTSGEYARLADLAPVPPGRAQVVTLGPEPGLCLDPLQVFAGRDRLAVALGFLTLATGTAPGEPEAIALAEALERVAANPGGRLADVVGHLEQAASPPAEAAGRALRHAARNPLAQAAFGEGEPVSLNADFLVFHVPGLSLPDRAVALAEHLARRLLPEQVLSQALLYLVAAVARQVTFSDPGRFAAAVFDEAWCLTSSLQGRALLLDGIRDGRKHNAAVWLLSQHPNDLGDDELAHLLGPRFVFRQSSAAAEAALHFVGVEPTEAAVAFLTSAPEGACLYRDVRGRVGRMQVLPALTRELHASFETNPTAIVPAVPQPA
ncbi:MAG TPA: ATP-binding protein, partial [Actinomycetota bacterium]|nr:ATP-binding protein [Actinomycetota bacterium]